MSGLWVVIWTIVIITFSAFFVGVEFALMSSKSHRLEEAAQRSVAGRAALKNSGELTLVLAGSQLGITICTLALGAITKPAVHHALMPVMTRLGLNPLVADGVAFVLALLLVTFLHLVVGEMAPKSWAISHPEKSAVWLSLPMRGFMLLTRPIIVALNGTANWLVHKSGSKVIDEITSGQDPDSLRHLVEHSANVGSLDAGYGTVLASALDLRELTVGDVAIRDNITSVQPNDGVLEIQRVSIASGHRRILVRLGGRTFGAVHVRDTLGDNAADKHARALARPVLRVSSDMLLAQALRLMRESSSQLAVVTEDTREVGLLSVTDIMLRLLPTEKRAPSVPVKASPKAAHPHPRL